MRHIATFNGRHNALKVKVLMVLNSTNRRAGLTALDIYSVIGGNYQSLVASLTKWTRWGYISQHVIRGYYGDMVNSYTLLQKGEKFLIIASHKAPIERYHAEIAEFRSKNNDIWRVAESCTSVASLVKTIADR